MSDLQTRLQEIEQEIHTLETATPRNSATVDRGGLLVVDEGSIIVETGGTVFFDEGGAATSSAFSITEGTGWQIGTERRGSSVVVLNDAPTYNLEVTTANSTAVYEELILSSDEENHIHLSGASSLMIQIFFVTDDPGNITVQGVNLAPSGIIKSQKNQWAYSYMGTFVDDVTVQTTMADVSARVLRLTVNNAA